jgi:hypothetical protein
MVRAPYSSGTLAWSAPIGRSEKMSVRGRTDNVIAVD